jgi:translation initiation factor IF-3
MRKSRRPPTNTRPPKVSARTNEQIGEREVRLIGAEGEQLGVMSAEEARAYAYARELDLVEVAATAEPPVCRVMDYGKWRFEEERSMRASRRNQVHV